MIDLRPYVRPGVGVWWSQASAEPTPLVHAFLDQVGSIGPVRAFVGLTWDERLTQALPDEVSVVSYGCLLYTSPSPRDRTRSRIPYSA